jgi:putative transposase
LFVAKGGQVRVRWSRDLPAEPLSVTIIREPDGHYSASFVVDVPAAPLPEVEKEAGVDVGIARLATVATTDDKRTDIANPKHLGRKLRKLARLEREKSRRQQGSTNRDKTRRKVARTPLVALLLRRLLRRLPASYRVLRRCWPEFVRAAVTSAWISVSAR